ncbi:MAG: HAMP domain-containing protein [Thermomicrobiales bacterium]|nr:HAMP domain-containing protein [Thermomicrobiales bacterium]
MSRVSSSARSVLLLIIAVVVVLGAVLTIATIWLDYRTRELLELAQWLAAGSVCALTIGVLFLWVVDRAGDGRYIARLAITGVLTVIVVLIGAVVPLWQLDVAVSNRSLLWLILGFSTAIAILFAVLGAWFDARPLGRLSNAASEIAGGHYGQRLPETGNLEIERLAMAVNLLASRAQSAALRQSNQDRARESLLLAIAADAQLPIDSLRAITQSMAGSSGADPVVTKRHLDALTRETGNLQRRIDEVEEIARLESGQVTLRMQPISLAQLVIAVCERLQPGAATRNIIIGPRVDFSSPRVLVDPDQTLRALEALVSYALSETPDGTELTVEMRDSGQFVQVAALETPLQDGPDIAERVTWESAHRRRESALSLAVAGRLIEIQGGSFLISRGAPGTPIVVVSLPRS